MHYYNIKVMKTFLLSFLLTHSCLFAMADENPTHFVVWSKDGNPVAYNLSENPKVTFTETDLIISAKGIEVTYAIDKMARFTYEDDEETPIKDLQNDEMIFKLKGEYLLFPALKANSSVSIYSAGGKLIFKKIVQTSGEYSFPISSLSAGTYLVTANGVTYKIIKK